ncbi:MAG: NAD(+) diphosphatase [Bacteroides sp.]|nr:NAD(+) diphosphatase [Bacteroides sp.]
MENPINQPAYWFLFYGDQLLLCKEGDHYRVPFQETSPVNLPEKVLRHSLSYQGKPAIAAALPGLIAEQANYEFVKLRAAYDLINAGIHQVAGKAYELIHWDNNTRYCPTCGEKTTPHTPISKWCNSCKKEFYPTIATAILALVRKEEKILLVHAHGFSGEFYSLAAGFLETGESLEECVAREVLEETSLRIKNIRYFGSQPWPYPSGLMVGFIADYESGEIKLQEEELRDGRFYAIDELPALPHTLSLARKMIDWWITTTKEDPSSILLSDL